MTITLAENLTNFKTSSAQVASDKVHITHTGGLLIESGDKIADALSITSLPKAATQTGIAAIVGQAPKTLGTAAFEKVHLVAGETLTVDYRFTSFDTVNNDFSFLSIGLSTLAGDVNTYLLADNNLVNANNGLHGFQTTININTTGDYNILIGSADVGDAKKPADLIVRSIAITPAAYTATPTGLRLDDGSVLLANGGYVLPNGVTQAGFLSGGSQALIGAAIINTPGLVASGAGNLVASGAGNLVASGAGNLIAQGGGNLISQDGGGLISQDGGSLVASGAGNLVASGAGNLVASGAGNLVASGAGNLVASGAGNLVASGAGNLVASGAGNLVASGAGNLVASGAGNLLLKGPTLYKTAAEQAVSVAERIAVTTPAINLQGGDRLGAVTLVGETAPTGTHQADPRVAALGTGAVVVWSDDNTASGHFEIRAQLLKADGTAATPSFVVSSVAGADQTNASVTVLAGGGFAVTWRSVTLNGAGARTAPDIHTQLFTAAGAKLGAEIAVGGTTGVETGAATAALAGGGFATVFQSTDPSIQGGNIAGGQIFAADGSFVAGFAIGSLTDVTTKSAAAVMGLPGGGFAVAYREANANAADKDGIYLDTFDATGAAVLRGIHVNSNTVGTQNTPAITVLTGGNLVVAWVDEGTKSGADVATLRAQVLTPAGDKLGGEIAIADTLSQGDTPALSALGNGGFTVTWDNPVLFNAAVAGLSARMQIFDATGANASDTLDINPIDTTRATREQAASTVQLSNGTLLVVDQKTAGTTSTIQARRVDVGSTTPPPRPAPAAIGFSKQADAVEANSGQQVFGADLNGDGRTDLISVGSTGAVVQLGKGDGTFRDGAVVDITGSQVVEVLADVNADGRLDLVTGGFGDATAHVFLGQADGSFLAGATVRGFDRLRDTLLAADVNGDSKPDLVATGNSGVSIALGNGNGTFQAPTLISYPYLSQIALADLNGDGKLDLIATEQNANLLAVSLGNGDGTFGGRVTTAVNASPYGVRVADFDGDGTPDILVATNNGNIATDDSLLVLLGKGDGTFKPAVVTALGRPTRNIEVGDLNGDGLPDVVATFGGYDANFAYTATVLAGKGDGTFTAQAPLVTGSDPAGIVLVDLNADGKLDVALTNASGSNLSIYLNGTAIAPVFVSGTPPAVAAGSNAAAGTHDVVHTDQYGNTVTDTLDAADRLVKEVVTDGTGAVSATLALTYAGDGTYTQHSELVTLAGSLSVDAVYGPKGLISEVQRDQNNVVVGTATVVYRDDGSLLRHTTTAGQPGFDDFVYSGAVGVPDGGFVSHTHTDGAGVVTAYDVNGAVITQPPPVDTTPPALAVLSQVLAADTGSSGADNVTSNGAVTLAGTVENVAGTTVRIFDGARDLGLAGVSAGAFSFATVLAEGMHVLRAVATDLAGNQTTSPNQAVITIDQTPPAITITTPGGSSSGVNQSVAGTVGVDAGAVVSLFDGDSPIGSAAVAGDRNWSTVVNLAAGSHTITARDADTAGNVGVTAATVFQVSSPVVTPPVTPPVSPPVTLPATPLVGLFDATTNGSSAIELVRADAAGPNYLDWQYIYSGSDSVAIATSTPNVFLHGGSGNDALQSGNGRNVLDGGAGSNFLTGGTGQDTFFTDARAAGVVWNTIANFGAGDAATLWGFASGVSSYRWDAAVSGAPGSLGATLRANIVGGAGRTGDGIDASITFAGISVDQARKLLVATGTQPAGNYLYLYNPGV